MSGRDHLQPQLFDPGPPEFEPGTWYHYSSSPDFDPSRRRPLHMGTPQAAGDRAGQKNDSYQDQPAVRGWAHQFKIRHGGMENTPEDPINDREAQRVNPEEDRGGAYYTNIVEDYGSISAVVPRASMVEHIGMEPHFPETVKEDPHGRITKIGGNTSFIEERLLPLWDIDESAQLGRYTYTHTPVRERGQ